MTAKPQPHAWIDKLTDHATRDAVLDEGAVRRSIERGLSDVGRLTGVKAPGTRI